MTERRLAVVIAAANDVQHEGDRRALAASLLAVGKRLRAHGRAATGESKERFASLERLVPRLQRIEAIANEGEFPVRTVRATVVPGERDPTVVFDERTYRIAGDAARGLTHEMLGCPFLVLYGPRGSAYFLLMDERASLPVRLIGPFAQRQPELTAFHETFGAALEAALVGPRADERLLRQLQAATTQFAALTTPEGDLAEAVDGATSVPDLACDPRPSLDECVVLDPALRARLERRIERFAAGDPAAPVAMCLTGPAGVGKSLAAHAVAAVAGARLLSAAAADLRGSRYGETAAGIARLFREARSDGRATVVIDGADELFVGGDGMQDDAVTREAVVALLAHWPVREAAGRLLLILNASDASSLDDRVLARLGAEVHRIDPPDRRARERIVARELKRLGITANVDHRRTAGLNGRDLVAIVNVAAADGRPLSTETFAEAVRDLRTRASTSTEDAQWSRLVLPFLLKSELMGVARRWMHAEELAEVGFNAPRTLLLTGDPGTGKTLIAKVFARELGLTFFAATPGELLGRYSGHTAIQTRRLFARARRHAPAVVFLDELDMLAGDRSQGHHAKGELLGQLLQELDGVAAQRGHVYLLAATNRPNELDAALLSRFGRRIEIPLPEFEERLVMLRAMLARRPIDFDLEATLRDIARRTSGASGRDLRELVLTIEGSAIDRALALSDVSAIRITIHDVEAALRTCVPTPQRQR